LPIENRAFRGWLETCAILDIASVYSIGSYSWLRAGAVSASGSTLSFDNYNLAPQAVQVSSASAVVATVNGSTATLAMTLGNNGVAMCSGSGSCSLSNVVTTLETSAAVQQVAHQPESNPVWHLM
jgi:hypothetical protein